MEAVCAKLKPWTLPVFSGIDWLSLLKSDLSADGLSHFTLTPSEQWVHTHILILSHAGLTVPSAHTGRELQSEEEHADGKWMEQNRKKQSSPFFERQCVSPCKRVNFRTLSLFDALLFLTYRFCACAVCPVPLRRTLPHFAKTLERSYFPQPFTSCIHLPVNLKGFEAWVASCGIFSLSPCVCVLVA